MLCVALAALVAPTRLAAQTAPAAPPASAPAHAAIAPGLKGRMVEDVRIAGNAQVSAAVIRNVVRTREGQPLDPATVEEDYQRIYSLRRFANVEATVEPTATGVIVTFTVTEQELINGIAFKGNAHVETQALVDLIDIKRGEAIDDFRIASARQSIEKLYRDRNYPYARVEVMPGEVQRTGQVIFNITEGPNVRIRKIQFMGNRSYSEDKLKDQIKSASWIWIFRHGTLDFDQLEDDVAAVRQFYEQHGFFDVRVGRKLTFSADQTEVMVTFVVDEGQRYVVNQVIFEGKRTIPESKLRADLKLTEGRPFDSDTQKRDIRQIVKAYSTSGFIYLPQSNNPDYLRVEPKTRFYRDAGKVDVIYEISEGHSFRIGRIIVRGNARVQDKVFLREMRVVPGQLYNSYELAEAADRIRATQLVGNVSIVPIGEDPNVRDILVEVTETKTAFFMIGAGVTSSAGVLGNISYEQRNFDISNVPGSWSELFSRNAFTGAGQRFRVQLEPGTIQSRAIVSFFEPWLLDQPYSFGTDFYYSTHIRENYDESRAGGRFNFGKRFNNELSAGISLRGEVVGIGSVVDKEQRAFEILAAEGHHPITSAGIDLRYDTTDSPIFPTRGYILNLSYEYAGAMGGDYRFHKFEGDITYHQTVYEDFLDRKTTLNYRLSAGYMTSEAPFFERFYGGDRGSIRGFRYRGVSPRSGIGDDPVGGNFMVTGSVELNFPIYGESLRGVVFTDAGTVEHDVRFGTIRASVGFGLRITLPMFGQLPFAIDFAIPVAKDRMDDTRLISFSLGFGQ